MEDRTSNSAKSKGTLISLMLQELHLDASEREYNSKIAPGSQLQIDSTTARLSFRSLTQRGRPAKSANNRQSNLSTRSSSDYLQRPTQTAGCTRSSRTFGDEAKIFIAPTSNHGRLNMDKHKESLMRRLSSSEKISVEEVNIADIVSSVGGNWYVRKQSNHQKRCYYQSVVPAESIKSKTELPTAVLRKECYKRNRPAARASMPGKLLPPVTLKVVDIGCFNKRGK
ncbi:hypothetical protein O6H91_17G009700 [Diphasiastrum complanatum]|uniref:Uncharacterized protein n=1 Tax=Diphasiastrum complanatum TaxID=34168 RepID=A0ACC2B418_DIPCM|nr:hypothetical protein O6H91_17G009700 [Diphasiastrum complanatum]